MPEAEVKVRSKTQDVPPGSKLSGGVVVAPGASGEASRFGEAATGAPRRVTVKLLRAWVDLLMIFSLMAVALAAGVKTARAAMR